MSDWNEPSLGSLYADFLDSLVGRDEDCATMFISAPTNPIEGMIRYVRASSKFQEYLSGIWTDIPISLAGGGTGAATAANARTNLGLGTIAVQDANNVAITGGSLSGVSANANIITAGNLNPARLPTDGVWTLSALLDIQGFWTRFNGLGGRTFDSVSVNYNLADTDFTYTSFGGDVNLPASALQNGRIFIIRRSGSTLVTVNTFGAETIQDGSSTVTSIDLNNDGDIICIQGLGVFVGIPNWIVLYRNRSTVIKSMQQFNQSVTISANSFYDLTIAVSDYTKTYVAGTPSLIQSAADDVQTVIAVPISNTVLRLYNPLSSSQTFRFGMTVIENGDVG